MAGCATPGAEDAARADQMTEHVVSYHSVGRVKWKVPQNNGFYFAVPHFTTGPRLMCEFFGAGQCEISVHARVLTIDAERRRKEYFAQMESLLPRAAEKSVRVRSYGSPFPVLYATLTDRDPRNNRRFFTQGLYVRGTFVIKFHHATNDSSGAELSRVLQAVHSAEPIDARAFLAWKLSDYKAVCARRFPALTEKNNAAFAGSRFADVDWLEHMQRENPDVAPDELAARFEAARQELVSHLAQRPAGEWERFCRAFPAQVEEAHEGM